MVPNQTGQAHQVQYDVNQTLLIVIMLPEHVRLHLIRPGCHSNGCCYYNYHYATPIVDNILLTVIVIIVTGGRSPPEPKSH